MLLFTNGCGSNLKSADVVEQQDNSWLTEEEIISTLEDNDIPIDKDTELNSKDYIIGGIEPTIYTFYPENSYDSKLFIYMFNTIDERKEKIEPIFGQWELRDGFSKDYIVKNAYLVLNVPFEDGGSTNMDQWEDMSDEFSQLSSVVFSELNDGKTVVYKGESQHWKGNFTIKYYVHFIKDGTGKLEYDNYEWHSGDVWYKGEDADSVGEININCEHGAGTSEIDGETLDQDRHVSMGSGGSNGALNIEKNATMTVTWNNQVETLVLEPVVKS